MGPASLARALQFTVWGRVRTDKLGFKIFVTSIRPVEDATVGREVRGLPAPCGQLCVSLLWMDAPETFRGLSFASQQENGGGGTRVSEALAQPARARALVICVVYTDYRRALILEDHPLLNQLGSYCEMRHTTVTYSDCSVSLRSR